MPTSRPPPAPPSSTCAEVTSSERPTPPGPSIVGVTATAELTPVVARTSARAARGNPVPGPVTARSSCRPALRWALTAWSIVVLLKSKVQLSATDNTSGVLADEKRRVAARRLAAARKPPTGEIAESAGRSISAAMRATIGPRKPTAATRKRAFISDVAAAVCGLCVTAETENRGTAAASAIPPPISLPRLIPRGSTAASASARVGATRDARRPAASTAKSATVTPLTTAPVAEPAGRHGEVGRGDSVAHEAARQRLPECGAGDDAGCRRDEGDDRGLPRDHAAYLAGCGGDCAQECDLVLALLDDQRHRSRDD